MRRLIGFALWFAMLVVARGACAADQGTATLCRDQAAKTERALGLPPGLLLAVGRVESGRADPASHDVLPWPWSVNDEGEDHVFDSAFDAIAYVIAARARGSRSIDVGCFQVNLLYHPDAFASLADSFDPSSNARAAGEFLAELHGRSNSWESAVEMYHSATPWRGAAYRDLVLARWAEASLIPPRVVPVLTGVAAVPGTPAATGPRSAMPQGRIYAARTPVAVHVQYPSGAGDRPPPPRRGRLPRVIVPSVDVTP